MTTVLTFFPSSAMQMKRFLAGTVATLTVFGLTGTLAFAQTASQVTLASGSNPATYGSTVTLTSTVTPSTATGNISFYDGSLFLGSATLSGGIATFQTSALSQGVHSLNAYYGGDANDSSATSNTMQELVAQSTATTQTTTALWSSVNPSTYGNSITLTANVNQSPATGTVTFFDGTTTLGTASLSGGIATLPISSLSGGTHSLTAMYQGDGTYLPSVSSTFTQNVNGTTNQTSTSTSLTSSMNPSTYGNTVNFTATVSPSAATGNVTFYDGSVNLGTMALSYGTATLSVSSLAAGNHSLTAVYNSNGTYTGSTSNAFTQTVNNGTTVTTISADCSTAMNAQVTTMSSAIDTLSSAMKTAWQNRANAIAAVVALTDAQQQRTALQQAKSTFTQAVNQAQQQYESSQQNAENAIQTACTITTTHANNGNYYMGNEMGNGNGSLLRSFMLLRRNHRMMMRR